MNVLHFHLFQIIMMREGNFISFMKKGILKNLHTIFFLIKNQFRRSGMMDNCTLTYMPSRLHTYNKAVIERFGIGEFLYRRCNPEEIENPFKRITIGELSHNRGGLMNDVLCNPDDVLFSIRANEDFQNYKEKVVCILEIKNLNSENKYKKQYTQKKDNIDFVGVMELLHDPVPCMYPHCVFR